MPCRAVSVPLVVPVAFPTPSPPPPSPPPPISPPPRSSGGDGGGAGDGGAGDGGAGDGGAPAGGNGASPPAGPLGSDVPDSLASGGLPEGSIAVIAGISAGAALLLLCGCVLLALLLRARRKRRFDASLRHTQITFFTHSPSRQNSMRRAADADADADAAAAAADANTAAAASSPSIETSRRRKTIWRTHMEEPPAVPTLDDLHLHHRLRAWKR